MTNEQVRKLLGGYATNSLTEAERQALFEAALDDQDLFNALQDEQALKELLADPVSRQQIQEALVAEPGRASRPAMVWSRWWAWGGIASAAAAAVIVLAVIRTSPPAKMAAVSRPSLEAPKSYSIASREQPPAAKPAESRAQSPSADRARKEPSPAKLSVSEKDTANEVAVRAAPAPAPPPPPPAAVPTQGQQQFRAQQTVEAEASAQRAQTERQLGQSFRDATQAAPSAGLIAPRTAVLGGFAGDSRGGPLRYSLVRRDASGAYLPLGASRSLNAGDAVRINVVSAVPGYLSIFQLDAAGQWKRVYPEAEPGLLLAANAERIVPDAPIVVRDSEQKLRLTLAPIPAADLLAKKSANAPATGPATPAPIVLDITIAASTAP